MTCPHSSSVAGHVSLAELCLRNGRTPVPVLEMLCGLRPAPTIMSKAVMSVSLQALCGHTASSLLGKHLRLGLLVQGWCVFTFMRNCETFFYRLSFMVL